MDVREIASKWRVMAAFALACVACSTHAAEPALDPSLELTRIAFGSCSKESKSQPIWDAVLAAKPQLFAFLGDNIYADTREIAVIERKYAKLASIDGFARLRESVPVVATWDDHDFGENDAGGDYPLKAQSREAFLRFWNEPADSPRRQRDGVYTSYTFGPEGRRVQMILLDLRYNRTPIVVDPRWGTTDNYEDWAKQEVARGVPVPGPYVRNPDPGATMLGERQWRWLEAELRKPADLRLIGSSLQVLADFPGWEAWINYARDHQRLIAAIRASNAEGVVFLSGDTHYGELSRLDVNVPYPLWDLTSSGLTEEWHVPVPNALRQGGIHRHANFGLIEIDWARRSVKLALRGVDGHELLTQSLELDALRANAH